MSVPSSLNFIKLQRGPVFITRDAGKALFDDLTNYFFTV